MCVFVCVCEEMELQNVLCYSCTPSIIFVKYFLKSSTKLYMAWIQLPPPAVKHSGCTYGQPYVEYV
jgi:hypothetical protein